MFGLYAAVVLIWGSTWIAIQYQLTVAPEVAVALRFALATVILMAWCVVRRLPMRFGLRDHFFMAALGVCLFSLNYVLIYVASAHLTSGLLAVVFSTIVIMNMVNGVIFFRRRPETRTLIGAAIGLSGIAMVFADDLAAFDLATGAASAFWCRLPEAISRRLAIWPRRATMRAAFRCCRPMPLACSMARFCCLPISGLPGFR